jgi:hypothetical protein
MVHPLSYSQFRQKLRRMSIKASGYGDLASDKCIWFVFHFGVSPGLCNFYHCPTNRFWFFAVRNNPDKAPLITWFNGGVRDTVC